MRRRGPSCGVVGQAREAREGRARGTRSAKRARGRRRRAFANERRSCSTLLALVLQMARRYQGCSLQSRRYERGGRELGRGVRRGRRQRWATSGDDGRRAGRRAVARAGRRFLLLVSYVPSPTCCCWMKAEMRGRRRRGEGREGRAAGGRAGDEVGGESGVVEGEQEPGSTASWTARRGWMAQRKESASAEEETRPL